jgi:hypothetical protein
LLSLLAVHEQQQRPNDVVRPSVRLSSQDAVVAVVAADDVATRSQLLLLLLLLAQSLYAARTSAHCTHLRGRPD